MMTMAAEAVRYSLALLGLLVAFAGLRDRRMFLCGALVSLDWAILEAVYQITQQQFLWYVNLAVDWSTAILLFCLLPERKGRERGALMLSYAVEIVFHISYGLSDKGQRATWDYYWQLHYASWLQVILLIIFGGLRHYVRSRRANLARRPYPRFRWGRVASSLRDSLPSDNRYDL